MEDAFAPEGLLLEHMKMPIGDLDEPVDGRPCALLFGKVPRSMSTSYGSSNHQVPCQGQLSNG